MLLSRFTTATRIGNATARSSAVFIKGTSKAKTLGIGIYWHCSLEAGKHVIHAAKSRQIDREYLTGKKWNLEATYFVLSNTLTCALCVRLAAGTVVVWGRPNGAHKRRQLGSHLLRLERRLTQSITSIRPSFRPSHSRLFASALRERSLAL